MALTERQKEIKKLLDQGKTPREVGEALGISENAVYQHRRRMGVKKTNGNRRGAAAKPAAKKASTSRQQPRKRSQQPRSQSAAAPASAPAAVDPLTAVRNRRTEVSALIGGAKTEAEQARKTADQAEKAYKDALSKVQTELDQLDTAEAVLTGKLKPPTKAPRKSAANNHKAEDKPAAPAPAPTPAPAAEAPQEQQEQQQQQEPQEQPQAASETAQAEAQPEAEAQDADAEAADEPTEVGPQDGQAEAEMERPGVPTLSEFRQEDAFAS